MSINPVRSGVDNVVTFFGDHTVGPEPSEMNARPPGEGKAKRHKRDQAPACELSQTPETISPGKRKQGDQPEVKQRSEDELGTQSILFRGAPRPKHRNGP